MEHLKIAIADDNQKILDLLDRVIGMEKDMNLVGKAKNGEEMCQIIKDKQPHHNRIPQIMISLNMSRYSDLMQHICHSCLQTFSSVIRYRLRASCFHTV